MFAGHYAPALAIHAVDDKLPLGALFVAVQLVDVAFAGLVLAGVERLRIVPGFTATNALALDYIPYTHSLVAACVWGIAGALLWRLMPGRPTWRTAAWFGLAVLSHWPADLLVHVPDLPLIGDRHKVGLGLWNVPAASLALEVGSVWLSGAWLARRRPGCRRGVTALVGVLTAAQLYSAWGPLPHSPAAMAWTQLASYAALAVIAWHLVDRPRTAPPAT